MTHIFYTRKKIEILLPVIYFSTYNNLSSLRHCLIMDLISTLVNTEDRRRLLDEDLDKELLINRLKECINKGLYPRLVNILCINKFTEDVLQEAFDLAKHSKSTLNNIMCDAINAKMMSYNSYKYSNSTSNTIDWEIVEDDWEMVDRVHNMGRPITSITGYTYYVN